MPTTASAIYMPMPRSGSTDTNSNGEIAAMLGAPASSAGPPTAAVGMGRLTRIVFFCEMAALSVSCSPAPGTETLMGDISSGRFSLMVFDALLGDSPCGTTMAESSGMREVFDLPAGCWERGCPNEGGGSADVPDDPSNGLILMVFGKSGKSGIRAVADNCTRGAAGLAVPASFDTASMRVVMRLIASAAAAVPAGADGAMGTPPSPTGFIRTVRGADAPPAAGTGGTALGGIARC